jgi:hypothetical protein
MDEDRPEWDAALADRLIGKAVIIGVTYVDAKGETLRRDQMHGVVGRADPQEGVRIDLAGAKAGRVYWLPPHVSNFYPAKPGVYRLKETDEEVVDPDFLSTWTIQAPETIEDPA